MNTFKKVLIVSMLTTVMILAYTRSAMAGCKINISMQNTSNGPVVVEMMQVKSKGGAWRDIQPRSGNTVRPAEKVSFVYSAAFGCKARRQYRYIVSSGQCQKSTYYPNVPPYSPASMKWTRQTSVNFGDIARHCK